MKTIFNTLKTYITKVDEPKWIKAIIIGVFTISILALSILICVGLLEVCQGEFDVKIILILIMAIIAYIVIIASIYVKIKEEVKDYYALISEKIEEYYSIYED